jgi:hypothetical protein
MSVIIENIPATVQDVSVQVLDQSLLKLAELTGTPGQTVTATYVYTGGDADDGTQVIIKAAYDSKADITRHSIRLLTIEDNDASGEHVRRAAEFVLAWNTPGAFMASPAECLKALGTVYGLAFATVTSKVPQPATINMINRYLVGQVW